MTTRRPTIHDVARSAKVSSATVSRVINGASSVDRELARRVQAAVRSTGYVPNAAGRSLRRGGSTQIAVVTPDAENPYFTHVISEVERMTRSQGYSVSISHTEDDLGREHECFAQLVARQVSGVILTVVDGARSDVAPLVQAGIPVVLVDRQIRSGACDLVATDNLDAGRQAAQHLIERGFTSPVVIGGPQELATTEDRVTGFIAEARTLGVELADGQIYRGDLQLESGVDVMARILRERDADAVYVTNNRMSAGAFEAIRGRGEQPALLATDDDLWTRLVAPSVSVLQQPSRATGRAAARMLGQRMGNPEEDASTLLLRSKVIERESTRPRT